MHRFGEDRAGPAQSEIAHFKAVPILEAAIDLAKRNPWPRAPEADDESLAWAIAVELHKAGLMIVAIDDEG
jgi:hypothetical protein